MIAISLFIKEKKKTYNVWVKQQQQKTVVNQRRSFNIIYIKHTMHLRENVVNIGWFMFFSAYNWSREQGTPLLMKNQNEIVQYSVAALSNWFTNTLYQ